METTATYAVGARRAYLWRELDFWIDAETDPVTWDVLCRPMVFRVIDDLIRLQADIYWKNKPKSRDEVTPEMKDRARAHLVTDLIDFSKGKALAFCHTDRTPSLSHFEKKNIARCFVCNKSFGAIDILMERDGYKFHDAVRALCGQ